MTDIPKALQLTEEEAKAKSYVIGTVSIDADGIFHMHYIGPHFSGNRKYFGNGVVSFRNVRELMDVVGSRLNKAKDLYLAKINEVTSNEPTSTESDSSGPGL